MWFYDLLLEINILGLGADPLVWALAGIIAVGMNQTLIKERDYKDAAKTFWIVWLVMITVGVAKNYFTFGFLAVFFIMGMIFTKKTSDSVTHTVVETAKKKLR